MSSECLSTDTGVGVIRPALANIQDLYFALSTEDLGDENMK